MKDNFEKALKFLFPIEGGYSNDPNDPGKETNLGISKRAHPNEDIKNMTPERATKIYYDEYWLKAGCDELPESLDICVFDCAVNSGVSRALKLLEHRIFPYQSFNYKDYLLKRMVFYASIPTTKEKPTPIRGWINRIVKLYKLVKEDEKL